MNTRIKVTRREVAPVIAAVFPEYRGKKVAIEIGTEITFYDLNWSGGTRNSYRAVRLADLVVGSAIPSSFCPPLEGKTVEIPMDVAIVEESHFCGSGPSITIHCRPENVPANLLTEAK